MIEDCGTCRFVHITTWNERVCRLNGPTRATGDSVASCGRSPGKPLWPEVGVNDWCGKWEDRELTDEERL